MYNSGRAWGANEMEVSCTLCGQREEIGKIHKDYQKLASNPQGVFICSRCNLLVRSQLLDQQKKDIKPI